MRTRRRFARNSASSARSLSPHRRRVTRKLGDAGAEAERGLPRPEFERPDRDLDPLDHVGGELGVCIDQHEHELVASDPGGVVAWAHAGRESVGQRSQHFVADGVPAEVVGLLEEVDVERDQCDRVALALGAGELVGEAYVERASVE